jgi:hypothetical protein
LGVAVEIVCPHGLVDKAQYVAAKAARWSSYYAEADDGEGEDWL